MGRLPTTECTYLPTSPSTTLTSLSLMLTPLRALNTNQSLLISSKKDRKMSLNYALYLLMYSCRFCS